MVPKLSYGKLEEFKSDTHYELIIIPFGSFSLLPDELVDASLFNLRSALSASGKILLTVMTKKGPVEEFSEWMETKRHPLDNGEIVEYKKVFYDSISRVQLTQLNYQFMRNGRLAKSETMDFPVRLYGRGEFETILKSNGLNDFVLHEVSDGYGAGNSFEVFECAN